MTEGDHQRSFANAIRCAPSSLVVSSPFLPFLPFLPLLAILIFLAENHHYAYTHDEVHGVVRSGASMKRTKLRKNDGKSFSPTSRSTPPPSSHDRTLIPHLRSAGLYIPSFFGIRSRLDACAPFRDTCLGRKASNSITQGANEFLRLNPASSRVRETTPTLTRGIKGSGY